MLVVSAGVCRKLAGMGTILITLALTILVTQVSWAEADRNPEEQALNLRYQSELSSVHPKLGRFLQALLGQNTGRALAHNQDYLVAPDNPVKNSPFVHTRSGVDVQVYITLDKTDALTLHTLRQSGVEIEIVNPSLKMVQAWVLLENLDDVIQLPGVRKVTTPSYGRTNSGSVVTQGDAILKANQLRARGLSGKGIRVGIISDGANDWATARAQGDLPAGGIIVYGTCSKHPARDEVRNCNEGTAMAEIVHDLAPDAQIAVAATRTSLDFIARINTLVDVFKADIIVDDMIFYTAPYFEDGAVAKAVATASTRVLFVSAAGNSGDKHYEANYLAEPGFSFHDFGRARGGSTDPGMNAVIPARTEASFVLQWNDPYFASSNDYDLELYDSQNKLLRASSQRQSGVGSTPMEVVHYFNSSFSAKPVAIVFRKVTGVAKHLELFSFGISSLEYNQASGSIFGHSGLPGVLTVGAVNASDHGHNNIAGYSSRGPARLYYPAISSRKKPDLVAIDGVSISGAGGFNVPFYGTSAAAPHVAAVAAQLMSVSPRVRKQNVRKALIDGAVDLGSPGFDYTYGYGRVDAVNALELLQYGVTISPIIMLLLE